MQLTEIEKRLHGFRWPEFMCKRTMPGLCWHGIGRWWSRGRGNEPALPHLSRKNLL